MGKRAHSLRGSCLHALACTPSLTLTIYYSIRAVIKNHVETRFKQMRRCFRMIDGDGSGHCSREVPPRPADKISATCGRRDALCSLSLA